MNDRIKAIRKYTGTKVSELAKALGVTASYIYGLESGEKTKLSDTLIELFVERFSINRVWLETGAGSPFSTSQTVEKDALTGLIHEYIDRIERVLEIITWSKVSDEHRLYHLLRFNDGNYLLITTQPILAYKDDNISIEIHDARDELQQRDIPILQLQLEDHWFNEYVLYPKREKLEALFFLSDVKPLSIPIERTKPDSPASKFTLDSLAIASAASEAAALHVNIKDLAYKTIEVLESETIYRTALASNINAFHHAIKMEEQMKAIQAHMENFERQMHEQFTSLKHDIDALQRECADLRNENATLKSSGPVDPPASEIPIPSAIPPTKSTGRKNT